MENIGALSGNSDEYLSNIQELIKANASAGIAAASVNASKDILDSLLEGAFQIDDVVPEDSTFSLHV